MTVQDLAVFPETVVLDVVQTVFDAPMPPYQFRASQGGNSLRLDTAYWTLSTGSFMPRLTRFLTITTLERPGKSP